jgi:hypothetical protein
LGFDVRVGVSVGVQSRAVVMGQSSGIGL